MSRPHVAVGDCERIRPGLIGQPANTVSSLAFVVAAVPLLRWSRRPGRSAWARVAAAAVGLHALSRTGRPLCSCDSRLQGHALFHVLAAGALVAAAAPRPTTGARARAVQGSAR